MADFNDLLFDGNVFLGLAYSHVYPGATNRFRFTADVRPTAISTYGSYICTWRSGSAIMRLGINTSSVLVIENSNGPYLTSYTVTLGGEFHVVVQLNGTATVEVNGVNVFTSTAYFGPAGYGTLGHYSDGGTLSAGRGFIGRIRNWAVDQNEVPVRNGAFFNSLFAPAVASLTLHPLAYTGRR